jgi:outer membrane protein assembly factor BamB
MSSRRSTSLLSAAALVALALALAGCGGLSIFSSSTPKPPLPTFTPSAAIATAWTVSLGSKLETPLQAVVADGKVFAAHADGNIFVLDEKTGAVIARFTIPSGSGRIRRRQQQSGSLRV